MPRVAIAAFYKFARLPNAAALRAPLKVLCDAHDLRGILLVAPEGINGTLAGMPDRLARAMAGIREVTGLGSFPVKTSWAETMPFLRMKVRLKAEIVSFGDPGVDVAGTTGQHVAPEDWNALITDPDVIVIDARNRFEVALGSFSGAVDPGTESFGDFRRYVDTTLAPMRGRTIAMFCTGGIRCEKATSYMRSQGFQRVFQLQGGILDYLARVPAADSLWQGGCFVFDGRVAVGHGLTVEETVICFGCRLPMSAADRASTLFEEGVSCPHCAPLRSPDQKASSRERHRQVRRATTSGTLHLGPEAMTAASAGSPIRADTTRKARP